MTARMTIAIVGFAIDGQPMGEVDAGYVLQVAGESDEHLAERAESLLGVLRARAIAIGAWRYDAACVSLRAPWPIPAYFGANGAPLRAQISLSCTLETRDAHTAHAPANDAPIVWVQHTVLAPLVDSRRGRLGRLVDLAHTAIRHEINEFLFADDRRVCNPHDPHHWASLPPTAVPGPESQPMTDTFDPAFRRPPPVPSPRRVVKLTLTIERGHPAAASRGGDESGHAPASEDEGEGEVLAEDFIVQADDESDRHFVARAALILGVLRNRSGTPPAPRDLPSPPLDMDAWPGLPRVGLERAHVERLEILVRSWGALGDAVLAGLLTVYGLHHEAGALAPGTLLREALRRYAMDDARDLEAVSALIDALERLEAQQP